MYIFCIFWWDSCSLIFRVFYDIFVLNLKRKCLDEGEIDEDKVEEYKVSGNEIVLRMVEKKKLIILID